MDTVERDVGNVKDMVVRYLTKADTMFSGSESNDKKKMLMGVGEIENLNEIEENTLGLGGNLEELGYRIAISDGSTNERLTKERKK